MDSVDKRMETLRGKLREAMASGDDAAAALLSDELLELDRSSGKSESKVPASGKAVALVAFGVVLAVLVLAFGLGAILGKLFPGKPAVERVSSDAVVNCQNALRSRLNYPATAKFPFSGQETRVDGGQYYVWYSFTAKNAFGVEGGMRGMCIFPPGSARNPEITLSQD